MADNFDRIAKLPEIKRFSGELSSVQSVNKFVTPERKKKVHSQKRGCDTMLSKLEFSGGSIGNSYMKIPTLNEKSGYFSRSRVTDQYHKIKQPN
jgi:hypothetical protein